MSNTDNFKQSDNSIIDFIQEGIIVIDKDYNIVKLNKWITNKFSDNKFLIGNKCYSSFTNNDKQCSECLAKKVFKTAVVQKEIAKDPFNENKEVYYEITTYPILDINDKVVKAIQYFRDITHIKKTEIKLKESEEKYKALYENAPLAYQSLNIEGYIIDINPAWINLLGYQKSEVLGKKFGDFLFPEYKATFEKNFQIFKEQGFIKDVMFRMKKKDDSEMFVFFEGCIGYTPDGKFKQTYCTFKNITEQINAEQALKERNYELNQVNERLKIANKQAKDNEQKLTTLIENLQGIAYQCLNNESWTMTFISQGVLELSGYDVLDIIDNNIISWNNIIHKDFKAIVNDKVTKAIANKETFTLEYKINCKDSQEKWVWEKGKAVYENNEIQYIEGFITDITPLKTVQQDLIAAKVKAEESNKLKTEFLNNMSHEIRTPMNGIMGFSELLGDHKLNKEKRSYYSKIVQNSSNQLLRVIDDILEISNLETKQIVLNEQQLNLNDVLMEMFSVFNLNAKESGIPIYLKKAFSDNESNIYSDKTKLNKILSNLIENALKFTNKGYVEIGYYLENDSLIIYIKDTGIGILPENKDVIFERFSQENKKMSRKYGGLGLGLSISKENAHILGGDITFTSQKNIGSTFFLSIPYKSANVIDANTSLNNISDATKKFTVLIAEDQEVDFLYIETLLEQDLKRNYKIIHTKDGKETLDECINNNIDLVLLDIKMPIINGNEVSAKLRKLFPNLPIIAQTAYSAEHDIELALQHGCNNVICKPINKDDFFSVINQFLEID